MYFLKIVLIFLIYSILSSCGFNSKKGIAFLKNEHCVILNDTTIKVPVKISCYEAGTLIENRRAYFILNKVKAFNNQIICTEVKTSGVNEFGGLYSVLNYSVSNDFRKLSQLSNRVNNNNHSNINLIYQISSEKITLNKKVNKSLMYNLPLELSTDCNLENGYSRFFNCEVSLYPDLFVSKNCKITERVVVKEMNGDKYKVKFVIGK